MSNTLRIEITDGARAQITTASAWWSANRPASPDAVFEELDRILGLLAVQPEIGTRARRATLTGVRRVTLSRIRYHLYYRVAEGAVQVLALWHTRRGSGPTI